MESIWIYICVILVSLLLAVLLIYKTRYGEEIKYVKMEMQCADTYEDFSFWKYELKALHLCIIPFLNHHKAKKIVYFFRAKKHK